MMFMNPRAIEVKYLGDYQLLITFTKKEVKQFDLKSYLHFPVYEPPKDESFCKRVKAVDGILLWNEYIDLDPDTVYLEGKTINGNA